MGLKQSLSMRVARARSGEDGAIAVMAAVLVLAVLASTALAVDVGRTAYVSRDQQGATDRAALDGVRLLHGAILDGVTADVLVDQVHAAAVDSMELRNPPPGGTQRRSVYRVDLGRVGSGGFIEECRKYYLSQGNEAPETDPEHEDYDPPSYDACTGSVEELGVDAVRLWTHSEVGYVLPLGDQRSAELRKMAVASSDAMASISAATTTAGLSGGVLDRLLSRLVGSDEVIELGAIGHEGILTSEITLGQLATAGGLGVGTVDELLDADLNVLDLLEVIAHVLDPGDGGDVDGEVATLAAFLGDLAEAGVAADLDDIRLGYDEDDGEGIVEVVTGSGSGADIAINAFELAVASLQAANRDSAVTFETDVLEQLPVTLEIIEPPVIAVGPPGYDDGEPRTVAKTSQLELFVELPVGETTTELDEAAIQDRVDHYRDRLDAANDCDDLESILDDLEDEVEAIEDFADDHGLLGAVGHLIEGLLTGLGDLIGDILGFFDGLFGSCPVDEDDVEGEIDAFEELLDELSEAAAGVTTTVAPTLTVELGRGDVWLDSLSCSKEPSATLRAEGDAASVSLPPTTLLDLGPVGSVEIELDGVALGSVPDDEAGVDVEAPFPSDPPARFTADSIGLAGILDGLEVNLDVLELPLGDALDGATGLLAPVLSGLDDELSSLLSLLGVELGEIEANVLDLQCTGRRLVE